MPRVNLNNKVTSPQAGGKSAAIQEMSAQLSELGIISGVNNPTDMFQANVVLSAMNITVSRETADFSFKRAENSDQGVDNPKIEDPDLGMLTPEPVDAADKFRIMDGRRDSNPTFSNSDFYNQDDDDAPTPDQIQQHNRNKNTGKGLFSLNLANHMTRSQDARGSGRPDLQGVSKYTTTEKLRKKPSV